MMVKQYLLDTHVALWWLEDPTKLAPRVQDIIADKSNELFISSVSFWEMAIKNEIGKLTIPHNIMACYAAEKIQMLNLSPAEALSVADLPKLHSDPFDRMLIAQAKFNDLVLITKDDKILDYPITSIKS